MLRCKLLRQLIVVNILLSLMPTASAQTIAPNPAAITFVLPQDLKFEGAPGEKRAKLYGDPEKPGPYAIIYQWEPGHNSKPHTHAVDRFGYVISGTWWMSSASTEDKSTLYPVPAGSFVTHKAGQVHWDGGVDNTALVLVTGVGPIQTTRLSQSAKVEAQQREIIVGSPGFMYNGGLDIITKGFQEETGIKVTVKPGGMEQVMGYALEGSADAVFLPADHMDEITAKGAIKPGTRKRVGRSYQGLAVRKGGKVPDISTQEKFIATLESANLVLHSRCEETAAPGTTGCTRTARMITQMLARPEFAKVKSAPSAYGEGGAALARNEGDMAIQNISQIVLWDNLVVVGPVPDEFAMYMDGVAAVPSKAQNPTMGHQFIEYATQKGNFPIWWSRGVDPRKGRE
jgi:quercetin dioxygenase-like cupin family protein/ABC-type molybdate transport system substrate-binding protein